MNFKFHKITSYTRNFQNFTCVFHNEFDIHFLGLRSEIFFGVISGAPPAREARAWAEPQS